LRFVKGQFVEFQVGFCAEIEPGFRMKSKVCLL